ncbi:halocyanin, partial [Halorubrum sp. E3]
YHCVPHTAVGMHGGIAVGGDVPTVETGGNTGWPENIAHVGVPLHAHWVGIAAILGIALTFVFTFYLLKYGESAHTGHGGNQ